MQTILIPVLAVLLLCAVVALLLILFLILIPMRRLKQLTETAEDRSPEALRAEAERIGGVPGKTAKALIDACEETKKLTSVGTDADPAAEERYKSAVVDGICASLLPQALKNRLASMTFSLAGGIQPGKRLSCVFYDHFFLDENTVCFSVGQVPGSGIAEALFAVVAQTTIRSQLRLGRSLTETMSDVNAQLYDLGGRNRVNALVCVMNTLNGRFSFVNAGSELPMLMQSDERYEWLNTPVYDPLGANERVSYRSEIMRLDQGDLLFICTSDLGEMKNSNGELFRDTELLSVLNRSRSRCRSTEELLDFVQNEASAFCESDGDILSYAAIAIEYVKGNRDFVFTLVRSVPEEAPLVTEFMRKTLEEGRIEPKDRAKHILLAEEMFALCCRACGADADVKIECAIKPEENILHLKMLAPMDGKDPLGIGGDASGGIAANYIRSHTQRATFEAGIGRDMLEIISELS